MIRLRIMPLVADFGEHFEHPLKSLSPKTHLVFTRDYRIFGQFAHFHDSSACGDIPQKGSIEPSSLPPGFMMCEYDEAGEQCKREDGLGFEIVYVSAGQLKTLLIPEDTSPTNRAIKAYIDILPDETVVILGWE